VQNLPYLPLGHLPAEKDTMGQAARQF